jgi:prophage regulatory protein
MPRLRDGFESRHREVMLERLQGDPGQRTLGELLQERAWAVEEIGRLRAEIARKDPQTLRAAPSRLTAETLEGGAGSPAAGDPRRLLRLPEVCERVGLGKTTIYQLKAAGQFPQPVRVAAHAVRWRLADILAWQEARRA